MARTKRAGPSGLSSGVSAAAPWKPVRGEQISSTDCVLAGAALALFLISQIFVFQSHVLPATRLETDGIGYMLRASGPLLQLGDFHGPGYSFAIRAVALLGIDLFAAAKIVSIVAVVAFLVFSWMILARWGSPREASIAVCLMAASPAVFIGAASILSDVLAAALFLGSFALLSVPRKISAAHFAAAGAVAALAYLTRSIYATALAAPIAVLLLRPGFESRLAKLRLAAVHLVAFTAIAAPWLWFVYSQKGTPFWSLNHLNLAFRMYRDGQGWNAFPDEGAFGSAWDVVRSDPGRFASLWLYEIARAPSRILHLIPPLAIVAAIGCLLWLWRLNRAKLAFLLAIAPYLLAVSLVWYEDRYYLIFVPLAAACAANLITGIAAMVKRIDLHGPFGSTAAVRAVQAVALASMAGFCVPQTWGRVQQFLGDQAPEYRTAADWLCRHGGTSVTVLAAKPHIAFYCGARDIRFRDARLQDATSVNIEEFLERARPTYFVVDERYAAEEFPLLQPFLDESRSPLPELLTPVFVADSPKKLVVYRLRDRLSAGARARD